jgi:hypothetical protein
MPDPQFYAQCLQDSFDALLAATVGKPSTTRTNRKKPALKKAPVPKKSKKAKPAARFKSKPKAATRQR